MSSESPAGHLESDREPGRVLELLIPGLFGAPGLSARSGPPTPVLDRLFARLALARETDCGPPEPIAALVAALGLSEDFARDWPTAPYCLAIDNPDWDGAGVWLHADPVHLRADLDQLRLFDAGALGIQSAEAQRLVDELNAHFQGEGIELRAPTPERWYLRAPALVQLKTTPLRLAMGMPLAEAMPTGADARHWNALMSEAQMLMHQSPVNQARADVGRPMINGLWLSGPGCHQPLGLASDLRLVVTDDPLTLGLAAAGGAPSVSLDDPILSQRLAAGGDGRVLVVVRSLDDALIRRDLQAWEMALARLDRQLEPILALLSGSGSRRFEWRLTDAAGGVWTNQARSRIDPVRWLKRLVTRGKPGGYLAAYEQMAGPPH